MCLQDDVSPFAREVRGKQSKVKVKVKVSLERAMKAQRGNRGIALLFL